MPLAKLYVEGDLDAAIYNKIFPGVLIEQGGSKTSLKPQARKDRTSSSARMNAGYLRDRDFDFTPPEPLHTPTVDAEHNGQAFGWRLNRHELESYLIDPRVISATFEIDLAAWETALHQAATKISHYQIARWTIGSVRSNLPPNYQLYTKPDGVDEMRLPADLSEAVSLQWCKNAISAFRDKIAPHLDNSAIDAEIERRRNTFQAESIKEAEYALLWCSGKDLFAAVDLTATKDDRIRSPKDLCKRLRDWIRENPDQFVAFYPELQELRNQFLA